MIVVNPFFFTNLLLSRLLTGAVSIAVNNRGGHKLRAEVSLKGRFE